MRLTSGLGRLVAAVVAGAASLVASVAGASDKGMSFIGASRASSSDITYAADTLAAAGGDVQFAFLPFEFNPDNPFGNATALVRSVLPRAAGHLRVTVYVRWFPHSGSYVSDQTNFWSAWNAASPNADQRRIRDRFMGRIATTDAWIAQTRQWASDRGLLGRLDFTIVPVLEDTCPTSKQQAYANLLSAVTAAQRGAGMSVTSFRRSCLIQQYFRVSGASLELHGRWSQVRDTLRPGDTWCNDGTHYDGTANSDGSTYSIDQFVSSQRAARERGVNVMYWDGAYNGGPYAINNWASRTVDPFTGSRRTVERQTLRTVLTAR